MKTFSATARRASGGLRINLNDFNYKGTGRPFVPYTYNPSQTILNRPF